MECLIHVNQSNRTCSCTAPIADPLCSSSFNRTKIIVPARLSPRSSLFYFRGRVAQDTTFVTDITEFARRGATLLTVRKCLSCFDHALAHRHVDCPTLAFVVQPLSPGLCCMGCVRRSERVHLRNDITRTVAHRCVAEASTDRQLDQTLEAPQNKGHRRNHGSIMVQAIEGTQG
jgi:hypothetical protein